MAPRLSDLNEWRGSDVVDPGGERIGSLEEIYYDAETDQPVFLGVRTGRVFHHLRFVPLEGTAIGRNRIATDRARSVVEQSPSIEDGNEMSTDLEADLFGYYQLPYAAGPSPSGRRLVRR